MGPWLIKVDSLQELEEWLVMQPPVSYRPLLMVVRGDGPPIREFLPNALDAAKMDEHRVVVWVRDPDVAQHELVAGLFGADEEILAVVLGADREVAGRVYRDHAGVDDAAFAFAAAA